MSLEIPASSVTTAPHRRSARPLFVRTPSIDDPGSGGRRQDLKPAAAVN
jgi:hypothetical protein